MKKSNKKVVGILALTALGGFWLYNRFSFKVISQDFEQKTVTVRLIDGLKTYKKTFFLGSDDVKELVLNKYILYTETNRNSQQLEIRLINQDTDKTIALLDVPFFPIPKLR